MKMWIADEWVVCEDYPSYMINRKYEEALSEGIKEAVKILKEK